MISCSCQKTARHFWTNPLLLINSPNYFSITGCGLTGLITQVLPKKRYPLANLLQTQQDRIWRLLEEKDTSWIDYKTFCKILRDEFRLQPLLEESYSNPQEILYGRINNILFSRILTFRLCRSRDKHSLPLNKNRTGNVSGVLSCTLVINSIGLLGTGLSSRNYVNFGLLCQPIQGQSPIVQAFS